MGRKQGEEGPYAGSESLLNGDFDPGLDPQGVYRSGEDGSGELSASAQESQQRLAEIAMGVSGTVNLQIDYGSEITLLDSSPIGQGQFGSVFRGLYKVR